uniref:WGS project CBMI000000000 data, contig CS3069_c004654 n=1 Tax=Fusarium clavum TaxID=2594811 RepID=A0A090MET8_9HYPO|nr:unnamed protein product [Fusarium clavum]
MFLTSRGAIIAEALASGNPCILESKGWQKIPDGLIEFPLLPKPSDMYHEVFGYFAVIPGLQSRVRRLNDDASDKIRASLLASAQRLYKDMRLWYGRFIALDEGLREPQVASPVAKDYLFHSHLSITKTWKLASSRARFACRWIIVSMLAIVGRRQ